jgi:Holliday junction resolvase RusA-like endonuclease
MARAKQKVVQQEFVFVFPKPPSVNALFRNIKDRTGRQRGRAKTRAYADWIAEASRKLFAAGAPRLLGAYELRLELGRRKGSDLDNYAKAVGDLLVTLKIVRDDHLCQRLLIEWADDLPSKLCRISYRDFKREPALAR